MAEYWRRRLLTWRGSCGRAFFSQFGECHFQILVLNFCYIEIMGYCLFIPVGWSMYRGRAFGVCSAGSSVFFLTIHSMLNSLSCLINYHQNGITVWEGIPICTVGCRQLKRGHSIRPRKARHILQDKQCAVEKCMVSFFNTAEHILSCNILRSGHLALCDVHQAQPRDTAKLNLL